MSTELFPSNGCYIVSCLHSCYLVVDLHVTISYCPNQFVHISSSVQQWVQNIYWSNKTYLRLNIVEAEWNIEIRGTGSAWTYE
jgi:hypothetical protein